MIVATGAKRVNQLIIFDLIKLPIKGSCNLWLSTTRPKQKTYTPKHPKTQKKQRKHAFGTTRI
ncbi:uncharacterized protein METZ01_LOCUS232615 [marine metagenome]|uniref:Uncharacterized protein n=1 Tax=marine metagenome TaxID=408172 RepID=A0A382GZY4_9ZZZZ